MSYVKRLWLLNKFEDIQIDAEEMYNGINLVINVIEYPKLNQIKFSGEYFDFKLFKFKKSKSNLIELLDFNVGDVITNQKIAECITTLRNDFIDRHYHDIEISYELQNSKSNNTKDILFIINSKSKSKIKSINIILNGKRLKSSGFLNNLYSSLK